MPSVAEELGDHLVCLAVLGVLTESQIRKRAWRVTSAYIGCGICMTSIGRTTATSTALAATTTAM